MRTGREDRDDSYVPQPQPSKARAARTPPLKPPVPAGRRHGDSLRVWIAAWESMCLLLGPVWWPHEPGRIRR